MDNQPFAGLKGDTEMDEHRQQLAKYIYQESQKGNYSSSASLYEAVLHELNNTSDKGIEIMLKQKEQTIHE